MKKALLEDLKKYQKAHPQPKRKAAPAILYLESEVKYKGIKHPISLEIPLQALDFPASVKMLIAEHTDKILKVCQGIRLRENEKL